MLSIIIILIEAGWLEMIHWTELYRCSLDRSYRWFSPETLLCGLEQFFGLISNHGLDSSSIGKLRPMAFRLKFWAIPPPLISQQMLKTHHVWQANQIKVSVSYIIHFICLLFRYRSVEIPPKERSSDQKTEIYSEALSLESQAFWQKESDTISERYVASLMSACLCSRAGRLLIL